MQQSTSINEAFEDAERRRLRRAEYLLWALAGVTVNAETGNLPTDPEVLAEAMETREALDGGGERRREVAASGRRCPHPAPLTCLGELVHRLLAGAEMARAATLATRLKYLEKFGDEVRRRLRHVAGRTVMLLEIHEPGQTPLSA